MATVPLWVAVVISVGSPLLAFGGVLLGQLLTRRTATETETRWQTRGDDAPAALGRRLTPSTHDLQASRDSDW